VWGSRADFLIAADISDAKGPGWEQLSARQLEQFKFEICCVPFFAYGFALGDVVATDEDFVIAATETDSGHGAYRVWFEEPESDAARRLVAFLDRSDCLYEWSSARLIGIDAYPLAFSQDLLAYLVEAENNKELIYEVGKSPPRSEA